LAPHAEKRHKNAKKILSSFGLSQKIFCGVFELPLLRKSQKRHKANLKKVYKKGRYMVPWYPI
jgi:hypothetical protein